MNLEEAGRSIGWIGGFVYLLDVAVERFVMPAVRAWRLRRFLRAFPPEPPPNPYDRILSPTSAQKIAEANGEDWRTGRPLGDDAHHVRTVCSDCGQTLDTLHFDYPRCRGRREATATKDPP